MRRVWCFLAQFFDNLAKKSSRGKAKRDEFGQSVRQRAFDYFYQGRRPSELPNLGVPRTTIYRYYQSWKCRYNEFGWRILKRIMTTDADHRQEAARLLGVSEGDLLEALKHSRSAAQVKRKLGIDEAQQLQRLVEETRELELAKVIGELRRCGNLAEWRAKLEEAAKRMGIGEVELVLALLERKRRLRAEA